MKYLISLIVLLVAIASVCLQVQGNGLINALRKLDIEWQWVDSSVKNGASCDRISKNLKENQILMTPKYLAAFKLTAEVACMDPPKTGCSESEAMKLVQIFKELHIDLDIETCRYAEGIDKLAFDIRDKYIDFCSEKYSAAIASSLSEKVDEGARKRVEALVAEYGDVYQLSERKTFKPSTIVRLATKGFIGEGLIGKALFKSVRHTLPKQNGVEEFNWLGVVDGMKADCKAYVDAVKDPLEMVSKDPVVDRTLALSKQSWQLRRFWISSIACDQLNSLKAEKVAKKLASEAGSSWRV